MEEKLKLCPACKSIAYFYSELVDEKPCIKIRCRNVYCNHETEWFDTKEDAIKSWNEPVYVMPFCTETRIPVEFRPCPDCGCQDYPYLRRSLVYANGRPIYVQAECYRCGWETDMHNNVKECAKEWNETEV